MASRKDRKQAALHRRQFLKHIAYAGSVALFTGAWGYIFYSNTPFRKSDIKLRTLKDFRVKRAALSPHLSVVHGDNPYKMVKAAIEKLGGMGLFVEPGERVLLKPNVGWDRQPEQAANTNPEVVAAVIRLLKEANVHDILVTDAPVNDPYRCFSRSGIESAVQQSGGKVLFSGASDFVPTNLKGELIKKWPVSRYYHEVEKVINIPIVKHHSLTGCTLSMKNWYGILGGQRNRLHQKIHLSITDLAAAMRPTLTVMDATRVLKENGPTGGNIADVEKVNTVIAGTDEVAMDTYALRYFDLTPEKLPYLEMGEKRGLGTVNLNSLNISESSV